MPVRSFLLAFRAFSDGRVRYVYLTFDPVNNWTLRERSLVTFKHATQSVFEHLPGVRVNFQFSDNSTLLKLRLEQIC